MQRTLRTLAAVFAVVLVSGILSLAPLPGRRGCVVSAIATTLGDDGPKSRGTAPRPTDVDPRVTFDALLAPGDDATRFDARRAVEVEAWVTGVHVGGWEGVNCFALDAAHRDTHIDLARTPDAPDTARVIAEVTPRWRDAMRARGVDWSTESLRAALVGRRVRVRGWLYFDAHHATGAMHGDPADVRGERNWRATAWEIHPATGIEVVRP
ncbi:hypothetical protein J421_4700 (plasmid) [Gemmatirosa kalamazoonensis]|uniref:Lipoprotein n=1 Tax=Gemmatirosa kalamazoonensis TaxID=861299 RepID=W0RPI4_9BACT|nr:hypothetical protein [Gemmatirosa kalamazoonensis]AHG92235.1 hypothetical protein J421_4700 [Gemmatirosa kalamazoonensis]